MISILVAWLVCSVIAILGMLFEDKYVWGGYATLTDYVVVSLAAILLGPFTFVLVGIIMYREDATHNKPLEFYNE